MSLRLRLTLLYATLLGGVVLILGIGTYAVLSSVLVSQIDDFLANTSEQVRQAMRVDAEGDLSITNQPSLNLGESSFVQLWDRNGQLAASSSNINRFEQSIDPEGLKTLQPIFRDSTVQAAHLRVLTVPLVVNQRPAGVLQIGVSLALIDRMQRLLLTISVISAVLAMALAGLAGWGVIGHALAPLETITQAATQITRADDLSRRVPPVGAANDEVGQLVAAFNQTLERLEQLFTTQRRFLADVSHELRTPLTVIKGNVGLMRRYGSDEESLSGIEAEVDRLTRMVGDLLLLAQAESGKVPLDLHPVDLDTVVLEVFQQTRILAGDRQQVKLAEIDQVQVLGDRDRLKQVLLNLAGNAIKYTPVGGLIQISLSTQGSQVRVLVSDNGPGILAEDLPHIFERFYRGEKSRTRARDSSYGLGLSIAYWIIRSHGGRIEVDSKEGQGTTFCVWLPLLKPEDASV